MWKGQGEDGSRDGFRHRDPHPRVYKGRKWTERFVYVSIFTAVSSYENLELSKTKGG